MRIISVSLSLLVLWAHGLAGQTRSRDIADFKWGPHALSVSTSSTRGIVVSTASGRYDALSIDFEPLEVLAFADTIRKIAAAELTSDPRDAVTYYAVLADGDDILSFERRVTGGRSQYALWLGSDHSVQRHSISLGPIRAKALADSLTRAVEVLAAFTAGDDSSDVSLRGALLPHQVDTLAAFEGIVPRAVYHLPPRPGPSPDARGTLLAAFVVDTLGRIERSSLRILHRDSEYLVGQFYLALPDLQFTPARRGGTKVRAWARHRFDFPL